MTDLMPRGRRAPIFTTVALGPRYARALIFTAITLMPAARAAAQDSHVVYRLGRDTMAIEQFTRTGNRMHGEVVSRLGNAVIRTAYDVALNNNGKPVTAIFRQRAANGANLPNQPTEVRLTFVGDSVKREAVYADSTNTRMLPAQNAILMFVPAYGLAETGLVQLRRSNAASATFTFVGLGTGAPGSITMTRAGGDTIVAGAHIFRADRDGRMLSVDATNTTQKLVGTRSNGRVDLNAIASAFRPAGALSGRGAAHASFNRSVVFANYGRPQVRERTVWGGVLVPFDTIWRAGANEATHLATTRELTFGNVVVPPGIYTMFIFNARTGPLLVINRQTGQWGTQYDQSQDVGRIPMQFSPTESHVEEFTIDIRALGGNRGAIEFSWGNQKATAAFTTR